MYLGKFLAVCGVCSRRKASELIKQGLVTVNDVVVKNPAHCLLPNDVVRYRGTVLKQQKKVYLLLNKPHDYITTLVDHRGRRTVMDLLPKSIQKRIFPVGRLDRNTTGVLLFTNDGDLAYKLSHPRFEVKKVYHATLDKPFSLQHLIMIKKGIELHDGFIAADEIDYLHGAEKNEVRIQIHSGRNRIVRRIFKYFGYQVLKLDRIDYAGLTKKGLRVGKCRMLHEQEVEELKCFVAQASGTK
jgi:23S rRNA pseudouridine2605 synthase